jgi:NAD(P)-dependent dehydrogenase (short-subunit alcohol dehydrogenase family)
MSTGPGNQVLTPIGAFTQQAAASLLAGRFVPIAASGAIPAHQPGRYVITKAGVAALTLAAPVAGAEDGVLIEVISTTANAHTITTPTAGNIQDGNTGGHNTVMTFNADKGASCLLCAYQGVWYVQSEIGCALSS